MPLNEENCIEKINSFSKHDWNPLLELIPIIEHKMTFYENEKRKIDENSLIFMAYYEPDKTISQFLHIVYDMPIIISFDWPKWDEGRKMARDEDFNFDTVDIPTKCKLITAIVRNDRFCDGALFNTFKSGMMLKILKSIKNQLK